MMELPEEVLGTEHLRLPRKLPEKVALLWSLMVDSEGMCCGRERHDSSTTQAMDDHRRVGHCEVGSTYLSPTPGEEEKIVHEQCMPSKYFGPEYR